MKTAIGEVSNDNFVAACVAFQQAKAQLRSFLGEVEIEQLDAVSTPVYDLANKALRRKMKDAKFENTSLVARGARPTFPVCIARAVRNKKEFTPDDVIHGLKRIKLLPKATDIRSYISSTVTAHPELFKRLERGRYALVGKPQALALQKKPKALPAAAT